LALKSTMSSKERVLRAIGHEEPDHVPLLIKWYGRSAGNLDTRGFMQDRHRMWRNQGERVEANLKLGLDSYVDLHGPQPSLAEGIRINWWLEENVPGELYPLVFKEWETSKGVLSQVIRRVRDWPYGNDIPLFSDWQLSRGVAKKRLWETAEDIEAFAHLFQGPGRREVEEFYERAEKARRHADEYQVVLMGNLHDGLSFDYALMGFAIERLVLLRMREPHVIRRLLDILQGHMMRALDWMLHEGVDFVFVPGWYCNAQFWPPKAFKEFLAPLIHEQVLATHHKGAKYNLVMSADAMPLLPVLEQIGVDMLFGPDPVQGRWDLKKVKEDYGDKITLWGGTNGPVTLGFGPRERIQQETRDAIRTLGPGGGFILAPMDQVFDHTPWENIQTMIETWRTAANYPIAA